MSKIIKDFSGMLGALLEISNDLIMVFDVDGTVVFYNKQALSLTGHNTDYLSQSNIRDHFYLFNMERAPEDTFPFPVDGSGVTIFAKLVDGSLVPVEVHCKSFKSGAQTFYVLIAKNTDLARQNLHERERLVQRLRQSKTRLEGVLAILSAALGSETYDEMSKKVLNELKRVMDADGVMFYTVESQGYKLQGASDDFEGLLVGRYYVQDKTGIPGLIDKNRRLMSLQFVAPTREEATNPFPIVIDQFTRERFRLMTVLAEYCSSVLAFPMYYGGELVAICMICWKEPYIVSLDEINLIEQVSDYISAEFVSALAQKERQKRESLELVLANIRNLFFSRQKLNREIFSNALTIVQEQIDFEYVIVRNNSRRSIRHADFSTIPGQQGLQEFPLSLLKKAERENKLSVISYNSPLYKWLRRRTKFGTGITLSLGTISDVEVDLIIFREEGEMPFEPFELEFWERFAFTLRNAAIGKLRRAQDSRISNALQLAMKNDLPEVPGVISKALYSSATDRAVVGGDYFDMHELDDNKILMLMGDISGKGVEAASMASLVKTAVAAYAYNQLSPSEIASSLNKLYLNSSRLESFTTLFVSVIDLTTKTAQYCCAGHPPAFLYHESETGARLSLLTNQSPIIGAFESMDYHNVEYSFESGDILYLYTDGTTETRNSSGDFFGEQRLKEVFLEIAPEGIEHLLDKLLLVLKKFSGGKLTDDVAMVALQFK